MAAYYYLLASLPMLSLESPPDITVQDFLSQADPWLTDHDRARLIHILSGGSPDRGHGGLVASWANLDWKLRNALARTRAQVVGVDPAASVRLNDSGDAGFDDPWIQDLARQALSAEHPLEAEKILERFRWARLEEWEIGHYFDWENVVAYGLKLRMIEYSRKRTITEGTQQYAAAYEAVASSMPLDLE